MNACGQSGGPLGSPGGSGRFLSLLATHLWDDLYLDTDPFAVHSGMGHELLPREEGRAEEGPGTPSRRRCGGIWGPWACLAHQLHRPLSYPLDTRFTFFSSENKEESRNKAPGPWNCASVCVCKAHPKADIPRASKKKKKNSPLLSPSPTCYGPLLARSPVPSGLNQG